jgi:hypothetical protein
MDVAVFVGFATAGPFDLPVPLEDRAQYAAVFGDVEVELGWDRTTGEQATSLLGPAVRAFFANGGRRCYAIRVGRDPATASLPLPGLVQRDGRGSFSRVAMAVRSPGTWADGLAAATSLEAEPGGITGGSLRRLSFDLEFPSPAAVAVGDLLRFSTPDWQLLVTAASVVPRRHGSVHVAGDRNSVVWIDAPPALDGASCRADVLGADGIVRRDVAATYRNGPAGPELGLDLPIAGAPEPGAILFVQGLGANRRALVVSSVLPPRGPTGVTVTGTLRRLRRAAPAALRDAHPDTVERLVFSLWARSGIAEQQRLDGLGFAAAHTRWPGRLPSDDRLFDPELAPGTTDAALWREARTPRFPLAGDGLNPLASWVPLGMDAVPRAWSRPFPATANKQARNGVADFDEHLFVDGALAPTRIEALAGQAEAIRWLAPRPRRLRGMHAVFDLDEATIAAVPDAVHRGWSWVPRAPLAPSTADPARPHPDTTGFYDCEVTVLPPPDLRVASVDDAGRFTLVWDAVPGTYVVVGSPDPAFAAAEEVYRGPSAQLDLYARGASYYRVYVENGSSSSDWSNAVAVDASSAGRVVVDAPADWSARPLLAVQRALMRLCAARGDVVCVLALPAHMHADDTLVHAAALAAPPAAADAPTFVPALDGSEVGALSYAALYHPWTYAREGGRMPPDGGVAGMLAARAATRGAWVAAANEPLRDVTALSPRVARGDLQRLQDGRVNEVRQEPHGFLLLDQDTLSRDDDVRPLNVRRLLCLLRRLALLHGPQFVFEPNDATLRRSIQLRFEELLGLMFDLGAFAGATRAQGFQVVTGNPPNTPQSIDEGELIVELKVAPSRPLAFLTVRLVNAAYGLRVEGA